MLEIVRLTGRAGEARASVGESSPLNTPFPTGRGTILDNWLRVSEQGDLSDRKRRATGPGLRSASHGTPCWNSASLDWE